MARIITNREGKRTRVWGEPVHDRHLSFRWSMVGAMYGLGLLLSISIALAIYGVASLFVNNTPDASAAGLLTVAVGFGSALGFLVAGLVVLRHVKHNRVAHAIAVAVLHLIVLAGVLAMSVLIEAITGNTVMEVGPTSSGTAEALVGFFALERSAVTALAGCVLAAALMPSEGAVPEGTQVGHPDGDRTL